MFTLSKPVIFCALAFGLARAGACTKSNEAQTPTESASPKTVAPQNGNATVGVKHDPPLAISAVPHGHWYCDMGTAHFTSEKPGAGNCPLCGMKLVEKKK